MPLQLIRQDITRMRVDAIVNSANKRLSAGSGVNGAIHKAAGPELLKECSALGGCKTGEAKATQGYHLPCKYIIHTVGPVWHGGAHGEKDALTACYRNCLMLAQKMGCESVAFPLISSGVFGYPKKQAMKLAVETISAFLLESDSDMLVYLLIFSKEAMQTGSKLFANIQQYIDDNYVDAHADDRRQQRRSHQLMEDWDFAETSAAYNEPVYCAPLSDADGCFSEPAMSLEEAIGQIDESFSEMLLRKVREKGMKNAECYKKANLDKKHFSKIINDVHYQPKKQTVLALAIALEMDLNETNEMLMKAGLALSRSSKFDIIVKYFIEKRQYDIFEINEVLFAYDQVLLGTVIA